MPAPPPGHTHAAAPGRPVERTAAAAAGGAVLLAAGRGDGGAAAGPGRDDPRCRGRHLGAVPVHRHPLLAAHLPPPHHGDGDVAAVRDAHADAPRGGSLRAHPGRGAPYRL